MTIDRQANPTQNLMWTYWGLPKHYYIHAVPGGTSICLWGHHDQGHPKVLTRDAWLNVEANCLAKIKVATLHTGPIQFKLPWNPWGCYTDNQCMVKQFDTGLCTIINGRETQEYWARQKKHCPEQLNDMDWSSLGWAMQSIPLSWYRWASKQMSSHFSHRKTWYSGNNEPLTSAPNAAPHRRAKLILFNATRKPPKLNGLRQSQGLQNGWSTNNQIYNWSNCI